MHTRTHTHAHIHTHIHPPPHTHTHTHTHHTHTHTYTHTYTPHTHTYTHTHTPHTHTHTQHTHTQHTHTHTQAVPHTPSSVRRRGWLENGGAGHSHKANLERGETKAGGPAGWDPGDATKTEATVLHPGRQLGAPYIAQSHVYILAAYCTQNMSIYLLELILLTFVVTVCHSLTKMCPNHATFGSISCIGSKCIPPIVANN